MSRSSAVSPDNAGGEENQDGVSVHSEASRMGSGGAASSLDLAFALRTVAKALESQQNMQEKLFERSTQGPDRSKVLSTIKLPDFDGHPSTSVRKYREWKSRWRRSRR